MGNRCVKSDEKKKIMWIDAKNLFGWAMRESLPYNEIENNENSHGWADLPRVFCTRVE